MATINEGDFVIIRQDKHLKAINVMPNKKLWMERAKFSMDGAIGCPCGTSFEMKQGTLIKIEKQQNIPLDTNKDENEDGRDNRNLVDTSENQKMTMSEIKALRNQGVSGENIVEQLIENSATFKRKSDFAQEKYIKKKKKKYSPVFTILKPNTRLMVEMYWNKGPSKICHLRMDSLAQLLAYSNVRANNKMLVVETCVGLVTGAVMERLGGHGSIYNIYSGSSACRTAYDWYNFPPEYSDHVYDYPIWEIHQLGKSANLPSSAPHDVAQSGASPCEANHTRNDEASQTSAACSENIVSQEVDTSTPSSKRKLQCTDEKENRKRMRVEKFQQVKNLIERADLDGMIIVTKYHPTPLVMALIKFLAPGRPIAVFCQHQEPLLDCYVKLKDSAHIVALKMTETWLRDYQVLSNRTHPAINMSGGGGYLLTGITVGE